MVYTGPGVNKRTVTENIGPGDNMSAVVTSGNNRNNGFQRNSFLRRSDSYRRAKNVLSPDLSKNNRKSVEIVTVNNNSSVVSKNNLTNGSSRQHESQPGENSDNPTTTTTSKSPIITSPPSAQNGHVVKQNEKPGTKNNFFRNLRSSFSFSSLRVKKSQARPSLNTSQISSPLEASPRLDGVTSVGGGDHYQVVGLRQNSLSSSIPSHKSGPAAGPQLTSTPSSSDADMDKTSDMRARKVKTSTLTLSPNTDNHWKKSSSSSSSPKLGTKPNKPPPPKPPVRFRTTALRNQYQRWSFAELPGGQIPPGPGHGYPPAHTCMGGYNNQGQYPPQYHPHQYHHHPPVCPHYHHPCCQYYPYYHPPPPRHIQRSSIASLRGLTHNHDAASSRSVSRNNVPAQTPASQILTKFETTMEGGYGYSVGGGNVTNTSVATCECPMCYHSVHNPCATCGCPSRVSPHVDKHRNVSQGSTSDYSSLSPDLTSQNSSSRDDNLNTTTESVSARSSSPEKETSSSSTSQRSDSPEKEDDKVQTDTESSANNSHQAASEEENKHSDNDNVCSDNTTCDTDNNGAGSAETDTCNKTEDTCNKVEDTCTSDHWTRDARDRFISNPRRHSWAGGKLSSVGIPKQTSLQDFKKLLAQKTPSQCPTNKTSAVELLSNSAKTDSNEPFYSSHIVGGSFRKKVSPRRDHRFAAIEEESETNKDDTLLQHEP